MAEPGREPGAVADAEVGAGPGTPAAHHGAASAQSGAAASEALPEGPLQPWEQHAGSVQMARFDYAIRDRILGGGSGEPRCTSGAPASAGASAGQSAGSNEARPGPTARESLGVQGFLITTSFSTCPRKYCACATQGQTQCYTMLHSSPSSPLLHSAWPHSACLLQYIMVYKCRS